jgi:hypothetical protein
MLSEMLRVNYMSIYKYYVSINIFKGGVLKVSEESGVTFENSNTFKNPLQITYKYIYVSLIIFNINKLQTIPIKIF